MPSVLRANASTKDISAMLSSDKKDGGKIEPLSTLAARGAAEYA